MARPSGPLEWNVVRASFAQMRGPDWASSAAASGGMGSFNDVYLCAANRHRTTDGETRPANVRHDELRSEIFGLIEEVRSAAPH